MPVDKRRQAREKKINATVFLDGMLATRDREEGDIPEAVSIGWHGVSFDHACRLQEDFIESSGSTLPNPWATQDTSAAGTPTLDYVDDAANGEFQLKFDSQTEAQKITLYWGDSLHISPTKQPLFVARFKINIDTAISADDRWVIGLASARNATLDDVADHAWFRIEADADLMYETDDDGGTDDDDNDTGVNIADDTYITVAIDMSDLSAVGFYVDEEGGDGFVLQGTTDASNMAAGDLLQVFAEAQKDGGNVTHDMVIDFIEVAWMR